ncbi:MAG: class I SAM-dependent methyltransferase [Candidatus Vogelbacteria bacterium]|nr:class I SAM-dependent methyltransferase [Candidatus Vogelbacteria bacterium]
MQHNLTKEPVLEKHSLTQHTLRYILLPFLNYLIPKETLIRGISKLSDAGEQAISRSGSSHAMESFYDRGKDKKNISAKAREYISYHVLNATKSTRNRLKIVENAIARELVEREASGLNTTIVTLGGGTCRSLIDVMDYLVENKERPKLHIVNIDLDATALERAKVITDEKKHGEHFKWVRGNAVDALSFVPKQSVNIVELIGLLEYLNKDDALNVIKTAYGLLGDGGLLVAANVRPNDERRFYERIGWPTMHYRTKEEFVDLIRSAGFNASNIKITVEPLKMHNIALVRK